MDIPIEVPRKEGAPPLVMPPVVAPPPAEPAARASSAIATERADEQGREVAPAAAKTSTAASRPAAPANAAASAAPGVAPGASPRAAAGADDGARAKAILEGQPVPAAAASATAIRIVVQVGAYTDVDKLREARAKVEQLGFKTYTQVVETDGAQRTRVRVGPFASKAEADKAAAKIKAAGLPVALLTL
jgi:DedD protein